MREDAIDSYVSPTETSTDLPTLTPANLALTRRWRVRNPNPFPLTVTWDVYQANPAQTGTVFVTAASGSTQGEVFFETQTIPGANTTRIFVNGQLQDTKASSGAQGHHVGRGRSGLARLISQMCKMSKFVIS